MQRRGDGLVFERQDGRCDWSGLVITRILEEKLNEQPEVTNPYLENLAELFKCELPEPHQKISRYMDFAQLVSADKSVNFFIDPQPCQDTVDSKSQIT